MFFSIQINGATVTAFPDTSCAGVTVHSDGTDVTISFNGVFIRFRYENLEVELDERYMNKVGSETS